MGAHHHMGPSSSDKWINCAGSVEAEADYPDSSSVYADEGSASHQLGEWTLNSPGTTCEDFLGEVGYTSEDGTEWIVDDEMCDYTQVYVDYVQSIVQETGGKLLVEVKVDISRVVPGGFGTSDAIVIAGDTIWVIDLKYGEGIRVDAEKNNQALCYAMGAFDEYDFGHIKNINIVIVQPRLDHISEWKITDDDLEEWVEFAHGCFLKTQEDNPPRNPTHKGCLWCKAKADCKPYFELNAKDIVSDFDDFPDSIEAVTVGALVNPNKLTLDELSLIHQRASDISSLMTAIKTKLTDMALAGEKIPDHKLVRGNSKRVYADEEKAKKSFAQKLGLDAIAPRKMVTPPQLEKLKDKQGKPVKGSALFKKHVDKIPGNLILAHEDDKRAEQQPDIVDPESEFAEVEYGPDNCSLASALSN